MAILPKTLQNLVILHLIFPTGKTQQWINRTLSPNGQTAKICPRTFEPSSKCANIHLWGHASRQQDIYSIVLIALLHQIPRSHCTVLFPVKCSLHFKKFAMMYPSLVPSHVILRSNLTINLRTPLFWNGVPNQIALIKTTRGERHTSFASFKCIKHSISIKTPWLVYIIQHSLQVCEHYFLNIPLHPWVYLSK